MRKVILFAEDFAHEAVLKTLIQRLADERHIAIGQPEILSARGGHGKVLAELLQYLREVRRGQQPRPDLLIVGTDGNCKGFLERRREVEDRTAEFNVPIICAIPEPHIERWLLLDSSAFKAVFGKGCEAPDQKCERGRYKHLLVKAIRDAGQIPFINGIEHAEDIVKEMSLTRLEKADESCGRFLKDVRRKFKEWEHA